LKSKVPCGFSKLIGVTKSGLDLYECEKSGWRFTELGTVCKICHFAPLKKCPNCQILFRGSAPVCPLCIKRGIEIRSKILLMLKESSLSAKEISEKVGASYDATRKHLRRLLKEGKIKKIRRGVFALA